MDERLYIGKAAEYVDRQPGTLRKWETSGRLPQHLHAKRDERNRRYWTVKKLEAIKRWITDNDIRPGKGLQYYKNPDPEKVIQHIRGLRKPKTKLE